MSEGNRQADVGHTGEVIPLPSRTCSRRQSDLLRRSRLSTRTHPRATAAALASVALVLIAGCSGGDDGDEPTSVSTPAPTTDAADAASGGTDHDAETQTAMDAEPGTETATAALETEAATANPTSDTDISTDRPLDGEADTVRVTSTHPEDDAFSIELPDGWVDVIGELSFDRAALAVRAATPSGDVFTNIAVITDDPVSDLEDAVERRVDSMSDDDYEVERADPIEIDGVEAIGYTFIDEDAEPPVTQTMWWFEHAGHLYIASVTSHPDEREVADAALTDVVGSWRWSDND